MPAALPRRWCLPLLWLLMVVGLAAGLGLRQPQPPDEPRFVLAARTMVDTGQWLLPHRGSQLYAEKPPVFMWLQAASYELVGHWQWSFLLPSLLAALLTLWLVGDLARRLWSPRLAPYAMAALFGTLQFGLMAKRAQIDMVLVAMTTLSLWGLLRHLCERRNLPALWLAGIAAGVGTVTKGVGFLPLLLVLPWLGWRFWQHRHGQATPGPHGATLLWLLPAFVLGTMVWLGPLGWSLLYSPSPKLQAYAHELLFKQTGTRYTNAWHHVQPAWYYLQVMLTLWLPGSLLLPWLARPWWRRAARGDGRQWLLLGWSLLVLLFFSASPGKREVYILPMLPALALAVAPLLPGLLRRVAVRRYLLGYCVALAAATLVLGGLLLGGSAWAQAQLLKCSMPADLLPVLGTGLLVFGGVVLALAAWLRTRRAGVLVLLTHALLWSLHGLVLLPALDPHASASQVMQDAGARIGPDAELGLLAWREQNLLQADRPVREFGFKRPWVEQWHDAGPWLAAAPQRRWLLVLDEAMSPCVDAAQVIDVGTANRNDWQLVPGTAWDPQCHAEKRGATADED
ncbi:MAG: Undecaprenyl phosphate-alpha-4-amino-4-deoxy-L-arabinose arabinosyl transferase [Stenotrophomonas maltophilia]|uniref:Undecaprenyl phosphate-alpha-4-amino-4-deoxy-L-arabinose arabinosyl transferase n=1 Tax=Stenotrophomonas maltophilia TaxID=40324 RepID=A0A7V8JMH2_STEMA|nr:MAG: Undecaprenyl phosphate-alpha-4-amino-4-deoxy-L-arabinose arabinosyl transferase [Stenotrophomonas maltophilia]